MSNSDKMREELMCELRKVLNLPPGGSEFGAREVIESGLKGMPVAFRDKALSACTGTLACFLDSMLHHQQESQDPDGVVIAPPEDSDCNTASLYRKGLDLPVGTNLYARPQPAAQDFIPTTTGDWPEDFGGENGRYENKCSCGDSFYGNKHRRTCKTCAANFKPAAQVPAFTEEMAEELKEILRDHAWNDDDIG
jgi:hypothetical protein